MTPRYQPRISIKVPAMFTTGSQIGEGRILDLTIPGCLIESPVAVEKGQSLQLKLFLPRLEKPLSVTLGVVRWTNGIQFGVEFLKMEPSQRQMLNRFIASQLSPPARTRGTGNSFSDPGGRNWHLETYSSSRRR